MTKAQKSLFKTTRGQRKRAALLQLVRTQQAAMGKYAAWGPAYARKCAKKGQAAPD